MQIKAYSPSHITGFFQVFKNGSKGAGINLEKGMETEVVIEKGEGIDIYINGKRTEAPVSLCVINKFFNLIKKKFSIKVNYMAEAPIGYGLGMSGAGALSLSLALGKFFQIHEKKSRRIAHLAELECGTGLGSVIAESKGGFVLREKPGSFEVERIPINKKRFVVCGFLRPIPTKNIIWNLSLREKINKIGEKCLFEFIKNKGIENFMKISKIFAIKTGLADELMDIIETIPNTGVAMVGKTVFTITEKPKEIAKEYKNFTNNILISKVGEEGAKVL